MKKKWTRRKFLEVGVSTSIGVGNLAVVDLARPPKAGAAPQVQHAAAGLDSQQLEVLRAVADQIIPASDGMPAASEVGAVAYLGRLAQRDPEVRKNLGQAMTALSEISRSEFGTDFVAVAWADRVEALKKLEKRPPAGGFATLRDLTYEAYYTQPRIWKLVGYEFYPTNQAGPRLEPFDEAALAPVQKMSRLYREAP